MGSAHLISGYVAIAGATIAIINIFNARLFLNTALNGWVISGALIGIAGLFLVFWNEFAKTFHDHDSMHLLIIAIAYCLLGTYFASLGNIMSKRNQQLNMPILQTNAWGMLYGTICTTLIAILLHEPMKLSFSLSYITALLYLSTFGTVIAFGMYLRLLGSIGPERAAYIFILTPIVALVLSSLFEDFHWQFSTLCGIALILLGNLFVMHKPATTAIKEPA
jgi:drug/metabolite transporter (DMT)-like permease